MKEKKIINQRIYIRYRKIIENKFSKIQNITAYEALKKINKEDIQIEQ